MRQKRAVWMVAVGLGIGAPVAAQEPGPANRSEVRAYLDSALTIMEGHVLGRDTVDWQGFRSTVHGWAEGATEPADLYGPIRRALRSLNPHSFLQLSREQRARESELHPPPAASAPAERRVLTPFSGRENPIGELHERDGRRIGQIVIPGFGAGHLTAFADSIETLVREFDEAGACGWAVDLRGNSGGNMWPMLAGIGPLLNAEVVGYFLDADGRNMGTWFYRQGAAGIEVPGGEASVVARVSGAAYRIEGLPPVAVLFDGGTGSSGEAVAIAFIGRPNTRSFGVQSYGYTTANDGFRLPDSANMVLTIGVDADRNGVGYPTALVPDEMVRIVDGDVLPASPPADDPQLTAALAWLVRQPGCEPR